MLPSLTNTWLRLTVAIVSGAVLFHSATGTAQNTPAANVSTQQEAGTGKAAAEELPQIAEEPQTIDPAALVAPAVRQAVSLSLKETPLRDAAAMIEDKCGIPVIFDTSALADEGILLTDPVTDALNEEPAYLLLNRLKSLQLAWVVRDNVLRLTTVEAAREQMRTEPYNVADLLDRNYEADELTAAIQLAPTTEWEDVDGTGGSVELLGDVVFVRQTDDGHRQIRGLLEALRKHGRRTFTLDPPQHGTLRSRLDEHTSVRFDDIPLNAAVAQLAADTGTVMRLDLPRLKNIGLRGREPVSLTLQDRPLKTILDLLLARFDLAWTLADGVLWITTKETADDNLLSAIYDVRDLCRNSAEANALMEAVYGQTSGMWQDQDGLGGHLMFPQPGTMLVVQTERMHAEILNLLGAYRQALLASKVRKRTNPGSEVIVRYYQMQQQIAQALETHLPLLVVPDSWKTADRPDAPGTIRLIPSNTTVAMPDSFPNGKPALAGPAVVVQQSVLVIRQTRDHHRQISEVLHRIQHGDASVAPTGMGGLGGGGFGGGYFSVDGKPLDRPSRP